jgi:hypothetical protein
MLSTSASSDPLDDLAPDDVLPDGHAVGARPLRAVALAAVVSGVRAGRDGHRRAALRAVQQARQQVDRRLAHDAALALGVVAADRSEARLNLGRTWPATGGRSGCPRRYGRADRRRARRGRPKPRRHSGRWRRPRSRTWRAAARCSRRGRSARCSCWWGPARAAVSTCAPEASSSGPGRADRRGDDVDRRRAVCSRPPLDQLAAGPVRPGVEAGLARRRVAPGPAGGRARAVVASRQRAVPVTASKPTQRPRARQRATTS